MQRDRRQTVGGGAVGIPSVYLQSMYKSAIRSHLDWNTLLADPLPFIHFSFACIHATSYVWNLYGIIMVAWC